MFIHDGQGHPIYFQTFNGHADLGKNALKMMDTLSEYLEATTTLESQVTVNRILVMDAAGNGVKTLRELSSSDSDYYFITMLDSNQFDERKVKSVSGEITSVPETIFSADYVVKSYFDRWPMQELDFKDMKAGVNLHRVVSYGKKWVDNKKVLERIEQLQGQISELERELEKPLNEIRGIEKNLESKIKEERIYREKSSVDNGERKLPEHDAEILKGIQKEINSLKKKIKKIEKGHEKPFKSLKKKKEEQR